MEDAISILRGLKERYETHHKINIKDDAVVAAVQLSHWYHYLRFPARQGHRPIDEARLEVGDELHAGGIDEVERRIRQLEIEREAMKRENDQVKTLPDRRGTNNPQKRNARLARSVGERTGSRSLACSIPKKCWEQL